MSIESRILLAVKNKDNEELVSIFLNINEKVDIEKSYESYFLACKQDSILFCFLIKNQSFFVNDFNELICKLMNDKKIKKISYISHILKQITDIVLFEQILKSNKIDRKKINFFSVSKFLLNKEYKKADILFKYKEVKDTVYSNDIELYNILIKRELANKILFFS